MREKAIGKQYWTELIVGVGRRDRDKAKERDEEGKRGNRRFLIRNLKNKNNKAA